MTYKGYKILANANRTIFFNVTSDGQPQDEVAGINYDNGSDWGEYWYSVIDESNWVQQSFESIEECKQYINEETE